MLPKQKGFIQIPILVAVIGLLVVSAIIPIKRSYSDGRGDGNVQGVSVGEDVEIATDGGQTALVNKSIGALSKFPISLDSTTKQVTVETPEGSKVINVLPQQAVDNLLTADVIDYVNGVKVKNSLASIPSLVNLELKNGVLGYSVKGTKVHKLLGFIPIKTNVSAFDSAENGEVVESTTSLLGRILNRI